MSTTCRRLVVAEVVGLLLVAPYLGRFTVQANRYYVHWRRDDLVGMLLIATLIAALLYLGNTAVRRMNFPIANKVRDGAFVFLVGLGLGANLFQEFYVNDLPPTGAWLWALPVLLSVVAVVWHQAVKVVVGACLIVSPFIVLMPARMFGYPSFDVPVESLPTRCGDFLAKLRRAT